MGHVINSENQDGPSEAQDQVLPPYASFVLRCWFGEAGQIRCRLIDTRSGLSHPLANIAALPRLVHTLLEAMQDVDDTRPDP